MKSGFQSFVALGSKVLFTRDKSGSTAYPTKDLGTVMEATPTFDKTEITVEDGRTGRLLEVHRRIVKSIETWSLTLKSLSPFNLALLFSSELDTAGEAGGVVAGQAHYAFAGELIRLVEKDTVAVGGLAAGSVPEATDALPLVMLTSVDAMTRGPESTGGWFAVGTVNVGAKTIITDSDTVGDWTVGDTLRLRGCGSIVAQTVTVTARADEGGLVKITVNEAITGATSNTGSLARIIPATYYEVLDLDEGLIRIIDEAGATLDGIEEGEVVLVDVTQAAISSGRLMKPGSGNETITGVIEIGFADNDNESRMLRRARVSLKPGEFAPGVEDVNTMKLEMTVLENPRNSAEPGGVLYLYKGELPDKAPTNA